MTLVELSLYVEGYSNRLERDREQRLAASWIGAKLYRAKKIPPLRRILKSDQARPLPPDEAERERSRHQNLIGRLAPDAVADESKLQQFIQAEEEKYKEGIKARRFYPGESDDDEDE